jgi:hypothetical protein
MIDHLVDQRMVYEILPMTHCTIYHDHVMMTGPISTEHDLDLDTNFNMILRVRLLLYAQVI